jgi:hypothetical protein
MDIDGVQERARAAGRARAVAAGAAEAADRGWTDRDEATSAQDAAQRCALDLAAALDALARAPDQHQRLLRMLKSALLARSFEDAASRARAGAWIDAGMPPTHRDADWTLVWLLG